MSTRPRRRRHGIPVLGAVTLATLGALGGCADPGQRTAVTEWAAGQKIFVKVNDISAGGAPGSGGLTVDQWRVDAEVADTVSITEVESLGQAMDAAQREHKLGSLAAILHGRGWSVSVPSEPGQRAAVLAILPSARAAAASLPAAGCSAPDVKVSAPAWSAADGAVNATVEATAPAGEILACASALSVIRSSLDGLVVPSSVATRLNTVVGVTVSTATGVRGVPVSLTFDAQAQEPGTPITDAPVLQALLADQAVTRIDVRPAMVSWNVPDWSRAESSWRTVGRLTADKRPLSLSLDAPSDRLDTLTYTPAPGVTTGLLADLKGRPGVVGAFMTRDTLIVETTDRPTFRSVLDALPDAITLAELRAVGADGPLRMHGPIPEIRRLHPLAYAASRPGAKVAVRTDAPFLLEVTWPVEQGQAKPGGSSTDPEKWRTPVSEVADAVRGVGWTGELLVRLTIGDDQIRFTSTAGGPATGVLVSRSSGAVTPLGQASPPIAHVMAQAWNATAR